MLEGNILDFLQFVEEMFLGFVFVVPDGAGVSQNQEDTCIIHHSHVGLIHAADGVAKHLKTEGDHDTSGCHGFDMLFVAKLGVKEYPKPSRESC